VFVRLGKLVVIAAFIATTGAHWSLLQTVAWTTMLAGNLHSTSLQEALVKSFDGKHPCCLRKTIAAGKQSEKKTELSFQPQKLVFPPIKENFVLFAPSQFQIMPQLNASAEPLAQKPPTPSPRGFFV
jgi:hypothetical protein